jgi:hypothetical protein
MALGNGREEAGVGCKPSNCLRPHKRPGGRMAWRCCPILGKMVRPFHLAWLDHWV